MGPDSNILSQMRPFFNPRAIAVLGVSKDLWKFGSVIYGSIRNFAPQIPLYPVNSRISELMGEKVYPSISDLPEEVDLAVICLPAPLVPEAVRECSAHGISAVEVISGGFGETGTAEGKRLQAELGSLAGPGLRIVGPNCFGVYSPAGGVTIIPGSGYPRIAGSVGFMAQSGALTDVFCKLSQDHGFYINQAVSYGNACDINEVDLAKYFLADEKTRIAAAYIEGVRAGKSFFEAVQNLAAAKPTIIWKAGLSPGGAKAVASHTGSLAGSEAVWTAFFKQTGAIQALSLEDLSDTVSAFYHLPTTRDNRVVAICGAGGFAVAASDACYRAGLSLASFDEATHAKLTSILPPASSATNNPLDCVNPFPSPSMLRDILETVASSGSTGSIIIDKVTMSVPMRHILGHSRMVRSEEEPWLEELPVRIRNQFNMPVLVVMRDGGDPSYDSERRRLSKYYHENGVAVYSTTQRAFDALAKMIKYYKRKGQNNDR